MQKRESLDDLVKKGDVTFAYDVLTRFLQRVDQRLPLVGQLLQDFGSIGFQVTDGLDLLRVAHEPDLTLVKDLI
jgi:hypothetical protein